MTATKKPRWKILAAGWLLVVAGGALAHAVQTAGGIELRDVRFDGDDGVRLAGLLYVPPGASAADPAPAVLAVHGYINSRETQSGFAIELARRGYVVLALDQTGHGFSGGRALSGGYGGPAGLAYLRGLDFVDADNIGLEGHSMGGWAAVSAAAAHPEGYRSVALVGSATGPGFAPAGTPEFPRNLGVVFSTYDEFSQLMWGVGSARDVTASEKLKAVFGVDEDVAPGRVYGSVDEGTARRLATPVSTHPGEHLSRAAIGEAVGWLNATLEGEGELDDTDQIWPWKEAGTLIALIGGMLVLLGALEFLLSLPRFAALRSDGVGVAERASGGWWLALVVASAVPALTYFPLTTRGAAFSASALFPQGITNQILVWAIGNAVLALPALWLARRRRARVDARAGADGAGGSNEAARATPAGAGERRAAMTLVVALLAVACLYLAVMVSHWAFRTDLRFWVVALKPMAPHHVPTFLAYLLPFTAFFYLTQRAFLATLPLRGAGRASQYATGVAATAGGFALMVGALYAALLANGRLPAFGGIGALFTVIAIQFVPVLAVTAAVAVFAWRRTNGALVGAVICGLLVTWYIVAGQATHV
jgi:pimeloyl-ACP methyl ester carboxylesterase